MAVTFSKPPYLRPVPDDAGLGVGHIWTETACPAYRTLDGADCRCQKRPSAIIAALMDDDEGEWT